MAQVLVRFFSAGSAMGGRAQTYAREARTEELTSSGTAASSTIKAFEGEHVSIRNSGTGLVWAQIGGSPTAAVPSSSDRNMLDIGPGEALDFGPLREDDIVSVIDDS